MIIDIHCHPTIYPFHANKDIFFAKKPHLQKETPIINFTQSDFKKIIESKTQVVFISLYPIEQGFFIPNSLQDGILADTLIQLLLQFPKHVIDKIQQPTHNYFIALEKEYHFLKKIETRTIRIKQHSYSFKIISTHQELENILSENTKSENKTTIALFITIEGGHALGCGMLKQKNIKPNNLTHKKTLELLEQLKTNIHTIKNWEHGKHAPLFITLAHHFNNLLSGHQISFAGIINKILNQKQAANEPITELGKKIIKSLLSTENGKPIYIDTRHMSIQAKTWYYHFIKEEKQKGNNIPIISSHSAVNGVSTMLNSQQQNITHKEADKKYRKSSLYNPWDINLSDEEILLINESEGLIGLNFDERIIAGEKQRQICHKMNSSDIWMKPFINNIIYIGTVLKNNGVLINDCFNNICIGSDFDGLINPVGYYNSSNTFPDFENALKKILPEKLLFHFEITEKISEEIIEKILFKNVLLFIAKFKN